MQLLIKLSKHVQILVLIAVLSAGTTETFLVHSVSDLTVSVSLGPSCHHGDQGVMLKGQFMQITINGFSHFLLFVDFF